MADRWLAGRALVAGIALALVIGASGDGCEEDDTGFSSARSECPNPVEVVFGSAGFDTALARGELADDMESARRIAQAVAEFEDGTCKAARSGKGYRVTLPLGDGGRTILVRVMARGGGEQNYYRVIIPEKGAVDKDGRPTGRRNSHHKITDFAIDEILEIIDKIRKREGQ